MRISTFRTIGVNILCPRGIHQYYMWFICGWKQDWSSSLAVFVVCDWQCMPLWPLWELYRYEIGVWHATSRETYEVNASRYGYLSIVKQIFLSHFTQWITYVKTVAALPKTNKQNNASLHTLKRCHIWFMYAQMLVFLNATISLSIFMPLAKWSTTRNATKK
jgi:hypothetical protein